MKCVPCRFSRVLKTGHFAISYAGFTQKRKGRADDDERGTQCVGGRI